MPELVTPLVARWTLITLGVVYLVTLRYLLTHTVLSVREWLVPDSGQLPRAARDPAYRQKLLSRVDTMLWRVGRKHDVDGPDPRPPHLPAVKQALPLLFLTGVFLVLASLHGMLRVDADANPVPLGVPAGLGVLLLFAGSIACCRYRTALGREAWIAGRVYRNTLITLGSPRMPESR